MKWRTEKKSPPKVGDTRDRMKFAWLPVACKDGFTRWLCRVWVFEECCVRIDPLSRCGLEHLEWVIKAALPLDAQFVKMPRAANPPPVGTRPEAPEKPGWKPPKPDPSLKDWHPLHNPK